MCLRPICGSCWPFPTGGCLSKLTTSAPHVYDRNFTAWIAANLPQAKLVRYEMNPYTYVPELPADTSISDFWVYEVQ